MVTGGVGREGEAALGAVLSGQHHLQHSSQCKPGHALTSPGTADGSAEGRPSAICKTPVPQPAGSQRWPDLAFRVLHFYVHAQAGGRGQEDLLLFIPHLGAVVPCGIDTAVTTRLVRSVPTLRGAPRPRLRDRKGPVHPRPA